LKRRIAILGSTGSIGVQALDVIRQNPDIFEVVVLTANKNADLLIHQAKEFRPDTVVIGDDTQYNHVKKLLLTEEIKVFAGMAALEQVVEYDTIDIVLTAIVGFAGLRPTINAIEHGKTIAIANKETLVVGGHLITTLAKEKGVNLLPVDSEHSAIFQCLAGEYHNPIEKIILTASGGPFRKYTMEQMWSVTVEQALKHPNWEMGAKITIDSASMMNKGLEVIEAKWLFGLRKDQIDVVIHPQSIIHSLVQFEDGSLKAQMGLPDMRLPIQYALAYPNRISSSFPRFSFTSYPVLEFEMPELEKFRNLKLAYEAMNKGGSMPCVLNASNEIAVESFLKREILFPQIPEAIEKCMESIPFIEEPSLDDLIGTDQESRKITHEIIKKIR